MPNLRNANLGNGREYWRISNAVASRFMEPRKVKAVRLNCFEEALLRG